MRKLVLYTAFVFFYMTGFSQEIKTIDTLKLGSDLTISLRGQIVNFFGKQPLVGAHLFNLNRVSGTVTNADGKFMLPTQANDTIYISYLGFQSIKLKITNDLLKGNELVIELHEKAEVIDEVIVRSHKLIGVLEIDAKNVPKDRFTRIHIDGLPQTYEVGGGSGKARTYSSPVDAIFHPVDFVYNLFGKKPKQLRKLKKLRDEDELRDLMESKFNREIMMEYLEMDEQELRDLLNDCNYSDYFIKSASDLQLIEAVLLCYENHKAIKRGSTIRKENKK